MVLKSCKGFLGFAGDLCYIFTDSETSRVDTVMSCNMLLLHWLHRYSPMKLSVAFVVDELAFRDSDECIEFMTPRGVVLMPDGCHIDCKQSVAAVLAQ